MASTKTSSSLTALRLLGVTVALALLVAVVPASSKADTGEAPRRAAEAASAPAPRNAAKLGKETSDGPHQSLSQLRASAAAGETVRVVVGFDEGFTPEAQLSSARVAAQRAGIKGARRDLLSAVAGTRHKVVRRFDTIPYVALEVSAAALARLESSGAVTSIREDAALPPLLDSSVPITQAPTMWGAGYTGAGQAVAILDTGVESTHSFLAGKVVSEACFSAQGNCPNGLTSQIGAGAGAPCTYAADGCRHGTHVAGIAAGTSGSFSGVARDADLIPIQVFSMFTGAANCGSGEDPCALSFDSDQLAALEHVHDLSATIDIASANLSLGGGNYFDTCDFLYPAYQAAIANLRAEGIATVIATGNEGQIDNIGFPACMPNAVSVGSTDDSDDISSFSNNAYFVSLMAPGRAINSSVPGNGFDIFNGTSMATPHVAGAWALLRQANPTATVGETLSALRATGEPIPDVNATIPRINIADANDMVVAGTAPGQSITGVRDSPDPFTPKAKKKKRVKIFWELSQYATNATVRIRKKSTGKLIRLLVDSDLGLGSWFVAWNGKKNNGKLAKAGTYKYVIKTIDDNGRIVKKSGTVRLKR